MLTLISSMYQDKPLALTSEEEEKKEEEESKEAVSLSQATLDQALLTDSEISSYDYAGVDQQKIASKLGSLNEMMSVIFKAYNALAQVVKADG